MKLIKYLTALIVFYYSCNSVDKKNNPIHEVKADSASGAAKAITRKSDDFRKEEYTETVKEKIDSILVTKLLIEKSEITPMASLTKDLGADDLDVVEIIMDIEDLFKLTIPDNQAERVNKVNDLYRIVINRY